MIRYTNDDSEDEDEEEKKNNKEDPVLNYQKFQEEEKKKRFEFNVTDMPRYLNLKDVSDENEFLAKEIESIIDGRYVQQVEGGEYELELLVKWKCLSYLYTDWVPGSVFQSWGQGVYGYSDSLWNRHYIVYATF